MVELSLVKSRKDGLSDAGSVALQSNFNTMFSSILLESRSDCLKNSRGTNAGWPHRAFWSLLA